MSWIIFVFLIISFVICFVMYVTDFVWLWAMVRYFKYACFIYIANDLSNLCFIVSNERFYFWYKISMNDGKRLCAKTNSAQSIISQVTIYQTRIDDFILLT